MSDSESLGIDKIELRGGMGIGTKPHERDGYRYDFKLVLHDFKHLALS